jgi:hypothetical protein
LIIQLFNSLCCYCLLTFLFVFFNYRDVYLIASRAAADIACVVCVRETSIGIQLVPAHAHAVMPHHRAVQCGGGRGGSGFF